MKKQWHDLPLSEQRQIMNEQKSGTAATKIKKEKRINLGTHRKHNLKVVAAKAPRFAKLMCVDCNKQITWLNREQVNTLKLKLN
jgi:hypothetical protein